MKPPAILISQDALKRDHALQTRGKRKIGVTRVYDEEYELTHPRWSPDNEGDRTPVFSNDNLELSYFTEKTRQDRHRHRFATEIYTVQSGRMVIFIEDEPYTLGSGDTIVVRPGVAHEVQSVSPFLCQVIAVNIRFGDKIVTSPRSADGA